MNKGTGKRGGVERKKIRTSLNDITLFSSDGYHLPKRTEVWTNLNAIHMDETLWKNPRTFDPTHFLDEDGMFAGIPPAFKTFGGGRRICVGEVLAKSELLVRERDMETFVNILLNSQMTTISASWPQIKHIDFTSLNFLFPFQLLTAMFFQRFSISSPEGKEVKDDVVDFSLFNTPKPFELVITKRA